MHTKETYEFCVLCGPEEDAPLDHDEWEMVLCRECNYSETHDSIDEMVNS